MASWLCKCKRWLLKGVLIGLHPPLKAQKPPEYVGRLGVEEVFRPPYENWFKVPDPPVRPADSVAHHKGQGLRAIIVLGTWCDDSHVVVPQVLDYLTHLADMADLELYAVGRDKNCSHCPKGVKPERVPWVVLFRGEEELCQFQEYPPGGVKVFLDRCLSKR
ncbi:MAG: hypothetical protein N2110_03110 [Flavobacteriales bacterium]|nr:hypothetical protein [Flavobacteriales bacterium]MCX7767996.1 hypothetical protein [Flavobacteriales bacterium]MDW8409201.1 hypothetical protein [Flavobacteriales bacterium]